MKIAAIIAEFNPFHNGHKYIIEKAKEYADAVVVIMSGNYVQRGDFAVIDKFSRTEIALTCGADLVIELPTPWAMSTAQNFAFGGMDIAKKIGVDFLVFGSECGDIEALTKTAEEIVNIEKEIPKRDDKTKTYAKLRQELIEEKSGNSPLSNPNDILGIEYILASKSLGYSPTFIPIKRKGANHHDLTPTNEFCSATAIRENLFNNNFDFKAFLPESSYNVLNEKYRDGKIANISNCESAILYKLRTMSDTDYKQLPDISEGLENRIRKAANVSNNYNELLSNIKSKRYTMARIRRIILNAYIGNTSKYFKQSVPYLRVLGANQSGLEIIKEKSSDNLKFFMRPSELKNNPLFMLEERATMLYYLAQENPDNKSEFSQGVIIH